MKLEHGLFRSYRCQKESDWTYGFDVTFTPDWVLITGDIGHLALSRQPDMMGFIRTNIAPGVIDFHYVAQKAPSCIVTSKRNEWTSEFLWCVNALRWFVKKYDAQFHQIVWENNPMPEPELPSESHHAQ